MVAPQAVDVEVRVPRTLAERALAAAERTLYTLPRGDRQLARERAAALAAIGRAVSVHGRVQGDEVIVELEVRELGQAVSASLERW